jgi:hypothetical protein
MMIKKLGMILLLALGGCGGGNGTLATPVTGFANVSVQVGVGTCAFLVGLVAASAGTMSFAVDDTPVGVSADSLEIAIVPDSDLANISCNFATGETVVDDKFVGSASGSVSVIANSYDFLATCYNAMVDCSFNLTWRVTY